MLRFLFPRLTADPQSGAELFSTVTGLARARHWYVEGQVPDTIDGRFAVLASLTALALVRLERAGEAGNSLSVTLTERFIEVMESEHREIGLGDPKLGRTVRKLVGSLSRRVELWRAAVGSGAWEQATRSSIYKADVDSTALTHTAESLRGIWADMCEIELAALAGGRLR